MGIIGNIFEIFTHLDFYLGEIIKQFGVYTYFILFLTIFLETGLVLTPFLPGDSLIFAIGAIAAKGFLNIFLLFLLLSAAAILGDTVNYYLGSYFGDKVFSRSRFFKKEYLEKTKQFYKKHGGKTIIIARFIPIVRTFAPFVAGVGKMNYLEFLGFNVVGGILWVALFLFGGYYFGTLPIVKNNLTLFIFVIVSLSIIPPLIELIKRKIIK
ncbi:DedA family protein [Candidatus Pacearchaeota archaeon]|nr:DedA family protein [Candidatus Pacearchaeota archaeon]